MQQQLGAARVQGPRPLPAPPTSAAQPAASVPSVDSISHTFEAAPARPNALEAVYGGRAPPDPFDWSLSQQQHDAHDSRGGTFFVSGSGTQRLGAAPARPGLAFVQDAPTFARHEQQTQQLPTFNDNTSYSPPRTPQQLPPGARPLPTPPQRQAPKPSSPSPPSTRIPLATSSSILLHSGFWQILSASGSRFLTAAPSPAVVAPQFPPGFGEDLERPYVPSPVRQGPAGKQSNLKKNKRISVDMVGSPRGFQHLVHASDHEQAQDLLRRWHQDGIGKLGRPNWAAPIKDAARARVRARGIAEVQAHRAEAEPPSAVLQVTNGLSEITSSTSAAVEDDGADDDPQKPRLTSEEAAEASDQLNSDLLPSKSPGIGQGVGSAMILAESGTTRFSPQAWGRPGLPDSPITLSFDRPGMLSFKPDGSSPPDSPSSDVTITAASRPSDEDDLGDFGLPRNFVPSLTTIEKAASTKTYFEIKYHAILKKPADRSQRKALLEAELGKLQLTDRQRNTVRAAWALSETEYLRDVRRRVDVGSFRTLKVLGAGAFGVVSLVKERGTGQLYAMKRLKKADMLRKGQEGHVRAERDLLASAATTTRWTVRLAYSFQDLDHLYLCLDFYPGGDLLTLLIDRDTFPESMARFILAEMVLAVSETHRILGAIHRDIKPDNFLFDSNGHLAISDFGLATDFHWAHDGAYFDQQRRDLLYKHGIDLEGGQRAPPTAPFDEDRLMKEALRGEERDGLLTWRDKNRRKMAYSVVGTNNYFAVEVLRGHGYTQACDWWSVGVIAFEMLFGFPPFVSRDRNVTKKKILSWKTALRFPPKPRISREAQDVISSLICEPEDRLGSRGRSAPSSRPNSIVLNQRRSGLIAGTPAGLAKGSVQDDGVEEIMAHPFFKGIDFANIHLQTPPYVPQLSSPEDTRYFEDDIEDRTLPPPEIAPGIPAPDTTRDLLLRTDQGAALLEVRKGLAFQGWTYKKPRRQVYDPRRGLDLSSTEETVFPATGYRGESVLQGGSTLKRSLSV